MVVLYTQEKYYKVALWLSIMDVTEQQGCVKGTGKGMFHDRG